MKYKYTNLVLLISAAFVLVSCGPKTTEEAPQPEQKQEAPVQELEKPIPPEPLPRHLNNKEELTPGQKEELEIDEDNVMNPFPG
ncbi:MAG: hypothetical protein BGO67_01400 [Alphaproteobacteria bacterium 41-28]|nr:MAG: hypothetical protein BGO67_01400 [Alphaproteobacteria bacterium 41-28]